MQKLSLRFCGNLRLLQQFTSANKAGHVVLTSMLRNPSKPEVRTTTNLPILGEGF